MVTNSGGNDASLAESAVDPNAEQELSTILALMRKYEITGAEAQAIAKKEMATIVALMRDGITHEEVRTVADLIADADADIIADDESASAAEVLREAGITWKGCLLIADLMEHLPAMFARMN